MKIEVVFVIFIFASFKKVEGYDCQCPSSTVQLFGGQDSQVIQSQLAGCAMPCTVQVSTSDMFSVIHVEFQNIPRNMNVTVVDGNNRPINQNCGSGYQCDSNTSSITITFNHGFQDSNYEERAEIAVSSVPNPFLTSTMSTVTWWPHFNNVNSDILLQQFHQQLFEMLLPFVNITSLFLECFLSNFCLILLQINQICKF